MKIYNKIEIMDYINSKLKPNEKNKRERGEVFTPLTLINEMLDELPIDVWSNPDLKWLDPSVGIGNFPIVVYFRLMDGLKDIITDEEERRRHILENMIYMVELDDTNISIVKDIFDNDTYKLNIFEGSFIEAPRYQNVYTTNIQFDIIMGNPPYNEGCVQSCFEKKKSIRLWNIFIDTSLKILKPNGYLVFITPSSFLLLDIKSHYILENHILWLKIMNASKTTKVMNAGISVALYVLKNKLNVNNEKTKIITDFDKQELIVSNEYINKNYSLPLGYHNIFNKIRKFIETNNCKINHRKLEIRNRKIKETFKLPLDYKLEDMLSVCTYRIKDGIIVKKLDKLHPDADKRKIIIANKSGFIGAFIDDGRLGLYETNKCYILGNNLELTLKIMKFKISKILIKYTKYFMGFLHYTALDYIVDLDKLGITDIEEDEYYNLLGLDEEDKLNILIQ